MYAMISYGTEVIPHNPDRPPVVDINEPMFYGYETAVFDDTLSKEDIDKIVESQKKDEIFNEIISDETAVIYRGNYCILKHWINWKEITKEEYEANDYTKID